MAENRETSETPVEAQSNVVKTEQIRSIPGGTLVRTLPSGQQTRFMMAPVQTPAAVISSSGTIQTQVLTKVQGGASTSQPSVSRLNTIPIQAAATTSYHVPRGAAAVANIAVPRSSVATPIVRAPTNLQTLSVSSQHNIAGGVTATGSIVGRPVLGVTPWLSTCLPNTQGGQTTAARQSSQQVRPPPIAVTTRVGVTGQIRPHSDAPAATQTRPVLLHATTTHKQVTLTQQTQVQVTDKAVLKGYPGQATRIGVVPPPTPSLSRITTTLPPAMVSLHPAVLVPSGQSQVLKGTTAQAKVITQPSHGPTMQISSVPVSSVQQSAIAISTVVTRPVMIASGGNVGNVNASVAGVVRAATPKVFHQMTEPANPVYIHAQQHKTQQGGSNTVTNVVSLANTMYTLPGAYYEGNFQMGVSRPVQQSSSNTAQHRPNTSQVQTTQSTEVSSSVGALALTTMANITQNLTPKPNTSPRPSILRKRDPEGSPLKAQKNLNPVLSGLTLTTPSSPPSPPKRPESGNSGQSSGGSTTISATSSPGQGDPESPPIKQEPPPGQALHHDDERAPVVEMSPRKKPRKQQLTGNQINEPTFSEDEMEFISEDKIKREIKEEAVEEPDKCLPRRTMSLLNSYKHNWKARNNHFVRYSDVKVKEERKPTLSEIANQKQALQKLNGWKIYHLGSQMEDMVNSETEFFGMYNSLLSFLEHKQRKSKNKDLEKDMSRVNERIKANYQRSKVVKDQMMEAKSQVLKLFEHKGYVTDIITRSASKRSMKKRERI